MYTHTRILGAQCRRAFSPELPRTTRQRPNIRRGWESLHIVPICFVLRPLRSVRSNNPKLYWARGGERAFASSCRTPKPIPPQPATTKPQEMRAFPPFFSFFLDAPQSCEKSELRRLLCGVVDGLTQNFAYILWFWRGCTLATIPSQFGVLVDFRRRIPKKS